MNIIRSKHSWLPSRFTMSMMAWAIQIACVLAVFAMTDPMFRAIAISGFALSSAAFWAVLLGMRR